MENMHVFVIIIVIVLVVIYFFSYYEAFVSGSYDITPSITVDMDFKGSMVSTFPYYPNNLVNSSQQIDAQIKKLQSYQADYDGPTMSNYVSENVKNTKNINDPNVPNSLEGFSLMNPFVAK
jgi:preprotein translocase subunit SecF